MSIKRIFQTGLVLLLALSMLLSFASCKKEENPTPTVGGEEETADPNEKTLAFPKTDFKADFNILYPEHGLYNDFYFATEADAGETVSDAVLERADLVYDYLGVDVYGIPTPLHNTIAIRAIAIEVSNKVASGDDAYQMVLTQTFESVAPMAQEGYLLDFYEMENINLDADWWNRGSVDSLAINGVGYYALNDYMLMYPDVVMFNKQMLENYAELENPYTLVRNKEWTVDKMFEMCAAVEYDNQGLDDPKTGLYGFTAMADAVFISLIDSCHVNLFEDYDGMKVLNMSAGNEEYANLLTKIWTYMAEDWVYLYPYGATQSQIMEIDNGNALFTMIKLNKAYIYRESEVKLGILPYPKATVEQDYRTFDWSGAICVPNTVQETEMVEKTIDALAFFSTDTTVVAYYEKLLGGRLADAPDDAEMLNIVWDSIVLNPAINYINQAGTDLGKLIYTIADGVEGIMNSGKPGIEIASYFNRYKNGAQDTVNKILNGQDD